MRLRLLIVATALALGTLSGCTRGVDGLQILVSTEEPAPSIAEAMVPVLNAKGFDVSVRSNQNTSEILLAVAEGRAELAIVEEPTGMLPGVTTLVPLYPTVLHVMHRASDDPQGFVELIRDKNVYAGPEGGGARRLLGDLSADFNLPVASYTVLDDPWAIEPDVYFIFGGLLPKENIARLADYRLFGFGDPVLLGSGTIAEGIALSYPNIRTFVLPQELYGALNDRAILTLAMRSVLIAPASLDTDVTYAIARELIEHSQELAAHYSLVTQELHAKLDPGSLTQPLHPGVRRFIDKDKPGFLERYVEVITLGLTILAALVSGLVALVRFGRQRKKDRVDVYYRKILDLRKKIEGGLSTEERRRIALAVRQVQEEVFALLIDERVDADETLTIFLDLSNQVLKELELGADADVKALRHAF